MKEQGFPFEEETQSDVGMPKAVFILKFFEDDGLSDAQKKRSKHFRELAHSMSEWLPEGTVRTMLLERLLDMRDICVKKYK